MNAEVKHYESYHSYILMQDYTQARAFVEYIPCASLHLKKVVQWNLSYTDPMGPALVRITETSISELLKVSERRLKKSLEK